MLVERIYFNLSVFERESLGFNEDDGELATKNWGAIGGYGTLSYLYT